MKRAGWKVAVRYPGLYVAVAILGVLALLSPQPLVTPAHFGLTDIFQLIALWVAFAAIAFLQVSGGFGGDSPDARQARRRRGLWTVLTIVLLFSFLNNYASYQSLDGRIRALNANRSDAVAVVAGIPARLLQARHAADQLERDLETWAASTPETRSATSRKVALGLNQLETELSNADAESASASARLAAVMLAEHEVTDLPAGQLPPPTSLLRPHELAVHTNEATSMLVTSIGTLKHAWGAENAPIVADDFKTALDPGLFFAIDDANQQATRAAAAARAVTPFPIATIFVNIATLNVTAVLFPWLLLFLFLYGLRDNRLRQIFRDIWALDGQRPGEQMERALGNAQGTLNLKTINADSLEDSPNVRKALEDRTFSNLEYILSLGLLTILATVGWHFIFYPKDGLGLATLLQQETSAQRLALYLIGNLSTLTLGFLGGYLYSIGLLVRRYFSSDLYPAAFLQANERLITIFILGLVLGVVVPLAAAFAPEGSKLTTTMLTPADSGAPQLSAMTALTGGLAFFFGIFTRAFFAQIPALLPTRLIGFTLKLEDRKQLSVVDLDGVDVWVEARLREEGVETMHSMATVSIERLVRRTYFPTEQIVDWVDQALLFIHAGVDGKWMPLFRAAGIRTASDLIGATGFLQALRITAGTRQIAFTDLDGALQTLVMAMQKAPAEAGAVVPKLEVETVFEICMGLWSDANLVYVLNFQQARNAEFEKMLASPQQLPA